MTTRKKSTRGDHWTTLSRDSRGRWVRQSTKKKKQNRSTQTKIKTKAKSVPLSSIKYQKASEEKKVTKILDDIENDFNQSCPRCGGIMGYHKIRCGPEKLVSVSKCRLCNYWVPGQATA